MFLSICWRKSCFQCQSITCFLEIQARFIFFFLHKIKMSKKQIYSLNYLLHIGIMLTISEEFTILCLICLRGNREYTDSFQDKSVSFSFKWVPKYILFLAKLKGEGRLFWSGQAKMYPLNYLLHMGVTLTIIKVFIILFLICLWEQGTPWHCEIILKSTWLS